MLLFSVLCYLDSTLYRCFFSLQFMWGIKPLAGMGGLGLVLVGIGAGQQSFITC